AGVARHAAVDARDRLVEVVAIELLEHELLDLGDLGLPVEAEERRAGLRPGEVAERYALELLPDVVARRRQLGEHVLRRLHRALVLWLGVETLLLVPDRVLQAVYLEPVELRLPLLPRPAEDVVVGDRPQRADEEEERRDEPERPVGALLVVEDGGAARH